MALAYQFDPLGSPMAVPGSIATGPDGKEWFTVSADSVNNIPSGIGSLNPTTGAMTFAGPPTPGAVLGPMISALGGLYFAEFNPATSASAIGVVVLSTGAIYEFPLGVANAQIGGLTAGKDRNVYFTDPANNAIRKLVVDDPKHPVTKTQLPKLNEQPGAMAAAPNGLLFYGDLNGVGSYDPSTGAFVQAALSLPSPPFIEGVSASSPTSFALGGDGRLYISVQLTVILSPQPRRICLATGLARPLGTPDDRGGHPV